MNKTVINYEAVCIAKTCKAEKKTAGRNVKQIICLDC